MFVSYDVMYIYSGTVCVCVILQDEILSFLAFFFFLISDQNFLFVCFSLMIDLVLSHLKPRIARCVL